MSLLRLK
jgi:hypothetical protein